MLQQSNELPKNKEVNKSNKKILRTEREEEEEWITSRLWNKKYLEFYKRKNIYIEFEGEEEGRLKGRRKRKENNPSVSNCNKF